MSLDPSAPPSTIRWPVGRVVVLMLALGFAGLLADLRIEHVDVVKQHAVGWTPIVYSGVMLAACLCAVGWWNRPWRRTLLALFALAFIVGGLGMYLHNHGNLAQPPRLVLQAWTDPAMKHPKGPPPNAPMAFAGLGLLGILACLERFNAPAKP